MDGTGGERYLGTAEVARRLGIKPQTVYTYVSRGLLTSVRLPGRRGSVFALGEVDQLAERGGEGRKPSGAVERIRTRLTLIEDDELYYRGHRVADLVGTPVESVATLLWTGTLAAREPFAAPEHLVEAVRAACAALPATARPTDRLRIAVAVLGAADPLRFDLSPAAVTRAGQTLVGVLAAALPGAWTSGPLGARLWPALSAGPPRADLLETILVLLADHGLAVSTVAARVAASARAHPYAVVSAGLGAVDGHYHGAASAVAYRFLAEALADPVGALSERLRAGGVPGFGHSVYQHRDPRADLLLDLLPAHPVRRVIDRLRDEYGGFPNVDLALAAVLHIHGMPADAGEALFIVARTVGWIAHAIEEYQEPRLRFRPVGVYVGS